jgi:hypothetical protein
VSPATQKVLNKTIQSILGKNNRNQIWKTIINYNFTAIYFQQLTDKSIPGALSITYIFPMKKPTQRKLLSFYGKLLEKFMYR